MCICIPPKETAIVFKMWEQKQFCWHPCAWKVLQYSDSPAGGGPLTRSGRQGEHPLDFAGTLGKLGGPLSAEVGVVSNEVARDVTWAFDFDEKSDDTSKLAFACKHSHLNWTNYVFGDWWQSNPFWKIDLFLTFRIGIYFSTCWLNRCNK